MKEININGKNLKIAATVDATGLFCPMPIVKLKLGIEKINKGEIIELLSDDPAISKDLPAWCHETDNKMLAINKGPDDVYSGYIEKLH